MKWISIPLVILLGTFLPTRNTAQNQFSPLEKAIEVHDLSIEEIKHHLDLPNHNRKIVPLTFGQSIFQKAQMVTIETFYQKSENTSLIKLNHYKTVYQNNYAVTEGKGKTYFRLSDGNCVVVAIYDTEEKHNLSSPETKVDCLF